MNICATDIKMEIGNNEILKGVSIDSKNKEFVGIIGPNGSGKSTLLKCIYRTLKPNGGCIMLGNTPISTMSVKESAKKLAVVAQHNYYNFDFSVEEVKESPKWELTTVTYDLHNDADLVEGNVMTEYEEKFSSIGNPICKMEARFL